MDKKCSKCAEAKPDNEFNRRGSGLQPFCKDCDRKASRDRYAAKKKDHISYVRNRKCDRIKENKEYVLSYLEENSCVDCGESDVRCLEFDHVRGIKIMNVSKMVHSGYPLDTVKQEIEKCEIRCANHHRIVTIERAGGWKSSGPIMPA